MVKDNTIYLNDIKQAIDKIEGYLKDITLTVFIKEDMRHDAVIRQLEIIGEAAHNLSSDFQKSHSKFPLKEMIGMRNFLIHAYDDVDLKVVWKTVQKDIPLVKEYLKAIK